MRTDAFHQTLSDAKRKHMLVCGIESHICVQQTVVDLLHEKYAVHIVTDAVASRKEHDHVTALRKMELAGALPTTVEMCLFECLKLSGTTTFKKIQALIK